jgi:hypothetical protein
LKSFADLRHTLYNLHLYSINEETRSEHWVATPILPAPRDFHPLYNPWRTSITLISCRNDYLHLSPAIQNCYKIFYYPKLNSNFFLLVIAIGLLGPRPYLIVKLLWHQRRLPYWCTLVWNSHQLIPNKAYSPTGASIAEAIRRYF